MYEIELSDDDLADLNWFKKHEQNLILDGIETNLSHEPKVETCNRGQLRPNQTAEWKLRLGKYRVYYDVDAVNKLVMVVVIGLKIGNRVYFRGEERTMKTVTVTNRSRVLKDLLKLAEQGDVLLQTVDGMEFVLSRHFAKVEAFQIGESNELTDEIKESRKNAALMKFLDKRGGRASGQRGTRLTEVRRKLQS